MFTIWRPRVCYIRSQHKQLVTIPRNGLRQKTKKKSLRVSYRKTRENHLPDNRGRCIALPHQIHPKMVASKGIAILTPQEMWTNNFLCFGSFPSLLCICPAPSSAFDTGDWIQKASHLQVPYLWAMLLSYNKPTLNPKSTWMLWSCWLMVRLSA